MGRWRTHCFQGSVPWLLQWPPEEEICNAGISDFLMSHSVRRWSLDQNETRNTWKLRKYAQVSSPLQEAWSETGYHHSPLQNWDHKSCCQFYPRPAPWFTIRHRPAAMEASPGFKLKDNGSKSNCSLFTFQIFIRAQTSEIRFPSIPMEKEENHLCKKKRMINKDSINTTLVGVEKVDRLCPVANSDLHSTPKNDVQNAVRYFVERRNFLQQATIAASLSTVEIEREDKYLNRSVCIPSIFVLVVPRGHGHDTMAPCLHSHKSRQQRVD